MSGRPSVGVQSGWPPWGSERCPLARRPEDRVRRGVGFDAGEDVTCTFTNTSGSITVCKEVVPEDLSTWNFNVFGPDTNVDVLGLGDGDCSVPVVAPLAAGSYSVSETAQPGYDVTYACTGEAPGTGATANVTLAAGEDVTCTFTNTSGSITVCKEIDPVDASTWNFNVFGPDTNVDVPGLGDGECSVPVVAPLAAGSYSVSETAQPGYDVTYACTGEAPGTGATANVTLAAGEDVTCTFTNTSGSITVCKEVVPEDLSTWNFNVFGPDTNVDVLGLGDGECSVPVVAPLAAGSYTVTETTQPGYDVTFSCTGETPGTGATANVTLAAGEDVTCTFTNTSGSITVCKNVGSG